MKDFHPISSLVQENIEHYEDPPAPPAIQSALLRRWLQCAGRAAPFSHPLLFQSGRLVIFTQSPVWSTELRLQIGQIKPQLAEFQFNEVEIKVIPQRQIQSKPPKVQRVISDRSKAVLSSTSRRVSHPGLQDALARLGRKKVDS